MPFFLSLVDNAEIVFATLSATGRRILQRLQRGFDTVGVIEEASEEIWGVFF